MYDYPDAIEASIVPLTEEQQAQRLQRGGRHVVLSHGHYWWEAVPGFYEGVHTMSLRSFEDAKRPTPWCLGYRTALSDSSAHLANATMPMHLIRDVRHFDLAAVPSTSVRRDLRAFEKSGIKIVWVTHPAILRDQAYEVMRSWRARVGLAGGPSESSFIANIERKFDWPGHFFLAGIDGDRLLGYNYSYAVEQTGYLDQIAVATESMSSFVSPALVFAAVQVFGRSGVATACSGPHRPEKQGMTSHKIRQGHEVVNVPCLLCLRPGVETYLRKRRPHLFYRMTGQVADESK